MGRRKLTTIFCADVANYAVQVAADEESAVDRLHRWRGVMADLFHRHEGREINAWGDAVIAEFDSVVEAVRCAVDVQDALGDRARTGVDGLQVRIGINLGDVVYRNGDVYGEGVNHAARLEAIAPPGGIAISETVHALVHRRLALGFEKLPERVVKDGEEAVGGYAVCMDGRNEAVPDPAPPRAGGGIAPPASGSRMLARAAYATDSLDHWLASQTRGVRVAGGFILFFFLINLLFSGLATPWFIFPSAPFFLFILWSLRPARPSRGDP